MKKFLEIVKRQTVLAEKAATGSATAEELVELAKLNATIKQVTEPEVDTSPTDLTTMTLAEFQTWHEDAVKQLEAGTGDASLLAVVKRNLAAVKKQGKTKADDIVAVEIPVAKTAEDKLAEMEKRLKALEEKNAAPAPAPAAPEGDAAVATEADKATGKKPVSQALAMEAVETLLDKYIKLKSVVESGSFTKEELNNLMGGDWELKDIIRSAASVMQKAGDLQAAMSAVMPELEKLAAAETAAAAAPEGGAEPEVETDDDADLAAGVESDTAKSAWESGKDIAPVETAEQQASEISKRKKEYGY